MIRDIRDYFDTQIKKVDADIEEWTKDVFGNNDIHKSRAAKTYNLVVGPATLVRDSNAFTDEFDITLTIWISSKRAIQAEFDNSYDKSIDIRNNVICPIDVRAAGFSDVEAISITPIEEDSNDKTIRFDMEFKARVDFAF